MTYNFDQPADRRGTNSVKWEFIIENEQLVHVKDFEKEVERKPKVIIIDFHAEATSEKVAMGRYLDGRVSAVFGTHTHVGTIDTCILPHGTAYVTDVGMVGPSDSIIGDDAEEVINSFLTRMPHRFSTGKGKAVFDAVMLEVDEISGEALHIERIRRKENGG